MEPDKLQRLPCDVFFAVTECFSEINAPVLRKIEELVAVTVITHISLCYVEYHKETKR